MMAFLLSLLMVMLMMAVVVVDDGVGEGGFQSPYNQNPYCVGISIVSVAILAGFVGISIGFVEVLIGSD